MLITHSSMLKGVCKDAERQPSQPIRVFQTPLSIEQ